MRDKLKRKRGREIIISPRYKLFIFDIRTTVYKIQDRRKTVVVIPSSQKFFSLLIYYLQDDVFFVCCCCFSIHERQNFVVVVEDEVVFAPRGVVFFFVFFFDEKKCGDVSKISPSRPSSSRTATTTRFGFKTNDARTLFSPDDGNFK